MKYLLTVVSIFIFLSRVIAQVSQPARWELELKFSEESYSIISLKDEGLALVRDTEKYNKGKKVWDLVILDTALNEKWKTELELNDLLGFAGYEYMWGKVNLMFRRNETDILRAEMLMIDLVSHQMEHTKTEVNMQIRLTHYTVVDGHCIFGGYVGLEPILIIYDPFKNTNSIVPGFFLTETELLDVRPNKNSTFNILLSQHTQGKKKLIFRTLDKMGNILVEDEMAIDEEKTIMSGVSSVLEHDEVLIAGAFTFHNSKQASGIFNCVIDPFSDQPLQYTEFHQLQHFLDYLSDKKANKIKQKASQRENLGKPPEYRMNVGIHRIEEFKGGFALFGESFTMSTSGSANSVSSYSNPYSRAYGSSNGYQPFGSRYYTGQFPYSSTLVSNEMRLMEGFVIGFDIKGKRLWDYSITMDEFKTPSSEQVSDFVVKRNVPYFLFKDENELRFSNHNTDTIETKKVKPIPIKLLSEFEESKSTDEYEGNVRQWFGPNLYVWGVQTVRDSKVKGNDSRRVFYINKIRVD